MREVLINKLRELHNDESMEMGKKCLTAKSQDDQIWFQVTEDMLNISLPIEKKLFRSILKDIPSLPSDMLLLRYKSGRYITFSTEKISQETLVDYLMVYLEHFYGQSLDFTWEIEIV